jgi:predicted nucleic acid-binding protein
MNANCFFDTNILIYLFSNFEEKQAKTIDLFLKTNNRFVSVQVLNEFVNVGFKKKFFTSHLSDYIKNISNSFFVKLIDLETIELAIGLKYKYLYSYYDSLILASALQNNCLVLYSEDMKHLQIIENKLTIINPFL